MLPVECSKLVALVRVTCLLHNCETNVSGFAQLAEKITKDVDEQERRLKYLQNLFSESKSCLKKGTTIVNKSQKHLNQVLKLAGFKSYDAFVETWDKISEYVSADPFEMDKTQIPLCIFYHPSTKGFLTKFLSHYDDHLSSASIAKVEEEGRALNEAIEQFLHEHNFIVWIPDLDSDSSEVVSLLAATQRAVPVWIESPMFDHPVTVPSITSPQTISGLNGLATALIFIEDLLHEMKAPSTPLHAPDKQSSTNISHFENAGTVILGNNAQFKADKIHLGDSRDTIHHNYGNTKNPDK